SAGLHDGARRRRAAPTSSGGLGSGRGKRRKGNLPGGQKRRLEGLRAHQQRNRPNQRAEAGSPTTTSTTVTASSCSSGRICGPRTRVTASFCRNRVSREQSGPKEVEGILQR